jgi:hypothetical protein
MSNKKSGCLFCKEKAYHSSFNFRPFLRVITKYRDKEISREIFCIKWAQEQNAAVGCI